MRHARFASILCLVLAGLAGCLSHGGGGPGPASGAALRVENRSFYEMDIFVLRGSLRERLGSVPATNTRTFPLPASMLTVTTPLRFVADPVGSSIVSASEELAVSPGDTVTLQIQP
ncbi:MAG TPA: hypothetical protein VFL93_09020 [Longimicrobiaceae bacterium]|jgi:hypothetical protein|nr:hypothetical protein [Longimicrobiaceae bacterium]